jgi:hypothetical protein
VSVVDLSIEYPMLLTERFAVAETAPAGAPATGGLVLDVGFVHVNAVDLVVTASVRGWGGHWDEVPGFTARVWDGGLDFGARYSPGAPHNTLVQGWFGVGSGVRVGLLELPYWEDVATAGIGGWMGGGVSVGRGPLRPTFSLRADVSLRADRWDGTVQTSGETTTWSYYPGSARVTASAGIGFR